MTERQISFDVSRNVHERLYTMAEKAGMRTSAYARVLFEAAYSARCKPSGDASLDAAVARTVILYGEKRHDTAAIARAVGLSESTVVRIIDAWKSEQSGKVAA